MSRFDLIEIPHGQVDLIEIPHGQVDLIEMTTWAGLTVYYLVETSNISSLDVPI